MFDIVTRYLIREILKSSAATVLVLFIILMSNALGRVLSDIAGGELHTILGRPEFYSYQVNGTSLRDWVAKLVNGETISDVHCRDCSQPEMIAGSISTH